MIIEFNNKILEKLVKDKRFYDAKSSIRSISKAIGISNPFLYQLIKGHRNPSLIMAAKIADYFKVPIEAFLIRKK